MCVNFLPYCSFITQFSAPNMTQNVAKVVRENCSSNRGAEEDSNFPEFIIVSIDKYLQEYQEMHSAITCRVQEIQIKSPRNHTCTVTVE
jgi:hypothetical protein